MTRTEKENWFSRGFHFGWGAFAAIGLFVMLGAGASYLINGWGWLPTDDCDRSTWDRCGMRVLTDAKTGQQYLVTAGGGIIARAPNERSAP